MGRPRWAQEPRPADLLVTGEKCPKLCVQHEAYGKQVAVEQQPRVHDDASEQCLGNVDECPDERAVVHGHGHGHPEVEDGLPVLIGCIIHEKR